MISSKAHLLETYLCTGPASLATGSRASSMSTQGSNADGHMRFLGDGEALCVADSGLPFSKSMDSLLPADSSQVEQNRLLNFRNRLLWEENKRLHEELKQLKSQGQEASCTSSQTVGEQGWDQRHPTLDALLQAQSKRQGSVTDAISMLGQATKDHVLTFAPHGIRHTAVQLLLWTFYLENNETDFPAQPVRLNFSKPGASPELYTRASEWWGYMCITRPQFQENAQSLVDTHLRTEQAVEKPSEYNSAILQQIMMRYPEVKDTCPLSSDIVEKQCKPLGQLTTCII